MPETLDELFAAASADLAARTRPRGAGQAIAQSRRRTSTLVAATATAAIIAVTSFTLLGNDQADAPPEPAPAPTLPNLPGVDSVWYDGEGLHHAGVVTPTSVMLSGTSPEKGTLTLVRTGAVYQSQTSPDVWFHPWEGEPKVIGQAALTGSPWVGMGDRDGDNAAWFDGEGLVVYDTVRERELTRVVAQPAMDLRVVSSETVVWAPSGSRTEPLLQLDIATGEISQVSEEQGPANRGNAPHLVDVHDDVEVWAYGSAEAAFCCGPADQGGLILRRPGQDDRRYPAFISPMGSLSPDGRFLGGWTGDADRAEYGGVSGVGFVDVSTGDFFELPTGEPRGQSVAWAYGTIAMIETVTGGDGGPRNLYACDVEARTCELLSTQGDVVLPR